MSRSLTESNARSHSTSDPASKSQVRKKKNSKAGLAAQTQRQAQAQAQAQAQVQQLSRPRGRPSYESSECAGVSAFSDVVAGSSIRRDGDVPLWVQVKACIEDAIHRGKLGEGTRLPPEKVICALFGLSRPVIRSALAALSAEGIVVKMPRRGVFVAERHIETGFVTGNQSLFDDLSSKGHRVDFETYDFGRYPSGETEQRVFSLSARQQVVRLHRVYRVDGVPLTDTRISFPAHLVPGLHKRDVSGLPILDVLNRNYGIKLHRADRWIKGAVAPDDVAKRMQLEPGTPLLELESVAFDYSGNAVEYYRAYYNSEVSSLHIATDNMYSHLSL